MRKLPPGKGPARSALVIRPREPTARQLAVLAAFAEAGDYVRTAETLGMSAALVRNLLIEIREHYGAATTIQAYRAALVAGNLATPQVRLPT